MSPVRPRSPAPKSVLSAVHFSHNSAGQKQVSPAEARYPSGKGEVCKTFMRRFDPDPRLQYSQSHTSHTTKVPREHCGDFCYTKGTTQMGAMTKRCRTSKVEFP